MSLTFQGNGSAPAHRIHNNIPEFDVRELEHRAADGGPERGRAEVCNVTLKEAFLVQSDTIVNLVFMTGKEIIELRTK